MMGNEHADHVREERKQLKPVSTDLFAVQDLSAQNLTEIPLESLNLAHIQTLNLNYNNIISLPHAVGKHLSHLQVLYLDGNQLDSLPESIQEISCLCELHLAENNLTSLGDAVCKLSKLKHLRLTGNSLSTLPDGIGNLCCLEYMYVDENKIQNIPDNFAMLEKLRVLEMDNNLLHALPSSIGRLKSLCVLNVSNNMLVSLPDTLGDLENLEKVDVSGNKIAKLPSLWKSVKKLKMFCMDNNELRNLPLWIGELTAIEFLTMSNNKLQNQALPEEFGHCCKTLIHCDMGGNSMTSLPESLGLLKNLEKLYLGSVLNELERGAFQNGNWLCKLPDSICSLNIVVELKLDENQLGKLPDDFGKLQCLEYLDLGQNVLSELPASFCDLSRLQFCLLSRNHLASLPEQFGQLCSLTDLRLDNNWLTDVPESFSKLTKLHTLDLFNNKLDAVPAILENLTNLTRVDLYENEFTISSDDRLAYLRNPIHYPPRDPALKDNWRGKTQEDKVQIYYSKVSGMSNDLDFKSNGTVLHPGLQKSSIWRNHGAGGDRDIFIRRNENNEVASPLQGLDDDGEASENDEAQSYESETGSSSLECEISDLWHIDVQHENHSTEHSPDNLTAMGENWDDEIDDMYGMFDDIPEYFHPVNPPAHVHDAFAFCPADIHPQATSRSKYQYDVEDGQFDSD